MRTIRFGIVGCGLMGREFASAAARWCHLTNINVRPELVAVCDANTDLFGWYRANFPSIGRLATDYRELLRDASIEALYVAVPHHLHAEIYVAAVEAGKHLLGEKPFGIDREANAAIRAALARHPNVFARCSSEFPYFPAAQRIVQAAQAGAFGRILEVSAGLHHCSDLDPDKPLNWKRQVALNGAYGCMGDLGMHALHVPLRLGWRPRDVRAVLSKIVADRPVAKGSRERKPCETWDNATLLCTAADPRTGDSFPMTFSTKRISPGDTNTWFLQVLGTRTSMAFSSRYPKTLRTLSYEPGGAQAWREEDLGCVSAAPAITGAIFEFGFSDAILQMWAAFCTELAHGKAPFGCVTPEETAAQHAIFTAALESHARNGVAAVAY